MRDPVLWGGFGGVFAGSVPTALDAGLWLFAALLFALSLACAAYGHRLVRRLRGRDA